MAGPRQALAVASVVIASFVFASSALAASDPTMDKRTRAYVNTAKACELGVGLVELDIKKQVSLISLADVTTQARDLCDNVRSKLLTLDTKHFRDQASEVWYGVDRYKSGLNALLAYIDTRAPSKVIEARDKLREGDSNPVNGIKAINAQRRLYGLKPLKP